MNNNIEYAQEDPAQPQWVPVNVWETSHALVVVAPMPGVTKDDVCVRLTDGVLHLDADLRTEARKDYRMQEWLYGSYRRILEIGSGFGAPITASLGNGMIAVSLARLDDNSESSTEVIQSDRAGRKKQWRGRQIGQLRRSRR